MNEVRRAFLDAATSAVELVHQSQVEAHWDDPGACEGMTVGGIASHLITSGIVMLQGCLDEPEPESSGRVLAPGRFYSGQSLDLDHEAHRSIRDGANADARIGAMAIRTRAVTAVAVLTDQLAVAGDERLVLVLGRFTMTLDGLITTRLVELLAHSDDLATSLDLTYDPPAHALTIVSSCLIDVARRRHGDRALLRALARGDRTHEPIFPVF
jgi:mycothiol maleylpyruvate isomerase-like protein